ncbi:type II toxin-antitoxin system RelE/ParE family toxin [Psychrobacter sp. I-STPA10]|uniref:type II toxin-antitoxin system RelE/ParE family toxin n=1 Tax=Psychrobacter sp. I-STPA10 TaxID=2585769 RepID=UPI001E2DF1C4|nr:type II toxin-antitoxin system RelE/ParE family toxin [Psychrobacter sp. I-STPA10]
MSFRLLISEQAEQDMIELAHWYESQQVGLGNRFIDELENTFKIIQNTPQIYVVVYRDVRRGLLRKFPVMVLYLIDNHTIQVIAIMHASRNPLRWQDRVDV